MIYRPFVEHEAVKTGLWWSENPYEGVSPRNPHAKMGLDLIEIESLTEDNKAFVQKYWAVARGKLKDIGDVFQDFDTRDIVVSERIAEVIERLEPGEHDLVKIPNLWSLGSQERVAQTYYFLNVYAKARTVDLESSKVSWVVRKNDGKNIPFLTARTTEKSVAYESAGDDRHLWRDDVTRAVFMSEELVQALRDLNVRGFRFLPCTFAKHKVTIH